MRSSSINNQSAATRAIGLLMLLFIVYGTTIEAVHRHGGPLKPTSDAASITEPGNAETAYGNKTGCNDCLICQLHQNFSASLIALRLIDPPTQLSQTLVLSLQTTHHSQTISPSAGRAPPFTS
jgi:hypothetical protein